MENEFLLVLKEQMLHQNINTSQLAKITGIDRSFLAKIISGSRKPSDKQMVKKIIDAFMLSEKQKNELFRLYQIYTLGSKIYTRNEMIKCFIEEFSNPFEKTPTLEVNTLYEIRGLKDFVTFTGRDEVFWNTRALINSTVINSDDEITIVMQTDNDYFMQMFYYLERMNINIKVNHIICLENSASKTGLNTYNIECIKKLIPFLLNRKNYEINIYYDDVSAKFNLMSAFPYTIFMRDKVITISSDYESAMLYNNKEANVLYEKYITYLKTKSSPLITKFADMMELSMSYYEKEKNNKFIKFDLMDQPCLIWFLDEKIIKKYMVSELGDIKDVISTMQIRYNKFNNHLINGNKLMTFFTLDGLERFITDGIMDEVDSRWYFPIDVSDRIIILKRLLNFYSEGKYEGYIIDTNKFKPEKNLIIAAFDEQDINIIYSKPNTDSVFFKINEKSISNSIYLFLETFYESDYVEESIKVVEYLKKRIIEMEEAME